MPRFLSFQWTWPRRFVGLVVVAVLAGLFVWQVPLSSDDSARLPTTVISRGDVQTLVSATGILEPGSYVDVGAQVSGQLDVLHVRVGQEVARGDLLAEIDPTLYMANVDATRAQLKNQNAQVQDRRAQLRLAEIQFRRQQNLYREDATTQEALQIAEASLDSARAQLAVLQAQIEQTASTLRAEEANLGYANIYAPIDGTVVSIEARQGQTLNTNQQAPILMRIADLNTMRVRAQVSEADVSKLSPGMPVYFTTLGAPQKQLDGTLSYVEPTPEVTNNVVLYNALFEVANSDGRLLPNMTAQVFFIQAQALDVLRVPLSALTNGQVQVLQSDGTTVMRQVETGVTDRVYAEVLSGLAEGEEVVVQNRALQASRDSGRSGFRSWLR